LLFAALLGVLCGIPIRLGKTIQHAYILSDDTYEFKNIPVGKYYCKYMWTDPVTGKRLHGM